MPEIKILKPLDEYAMCPSCVIGVQWNDWKIYLNKNLCSNREDFKQTRHLVKKKDPSLDLLSFVTCSHCKQQHIFYGEKLVYPRISSHIKPHVLFSEYPKSKTLFDESLAVANDSPRAGLTLSRMCLESLVNDILTNHKESLNKSFKEKLDKLLELDIINNRIKKILDSVRTIGNKSTHNFALIELEDVTIDDCILVWKSINHILDSIKSAQELDEELDLLVTKVEEKDNNNDK